MIPEHNLASTMPSMDKKSTMQQIKEDQMWSRKAKYTLGSALLTTLISEAEMVGKNKRNGESTEEEVIQVVKKFVKGVDESIAACKKLGKEHSKLTFEKEILEKYLPPQMSEEKLSRLIKTHIGYNHIEGMKNMGQVMKWLNENYNGQFDGKMASSIVKTVLSG